MVCLERRQVLTGQLYPMLRVGFTIGSAIVVTKRVW